MRLKEIHEPWGCSAVLERTRKIGGMITVMTVRSGSCGMVEWGDESAATDDADLAAEGAGVPIEFGHPDRDDVPAEFLVGFGSRPVECWKIVDGHIESLHSVAPLQNDVVVAGVDPGSACEQDRHTCDGEPLSFHACDNVLEWQVCE